MKYLQTKDIVHYLVESLRKVFAQNTIWLNENQEVVEITGANIPTVYDHQPREPEKYPIVVIEGVGGPVDNWGIDDFIDSVWVSERFGSVPNDYEILGSGHKVAVGIQVSDFLKLRDIGIAIRFGSRLNGDVNVNFSSASANAPGIAIASGAIDAFEDKDFLYKWVELNPPIILAPNQLYYAEYEAPDDCIYYVAKDTNPNLNITAHPYLATQYGVGWNVSSSSTLLAIAQGPVYKRLGGGIQVNLSLRAEAKDIWTMHSIEDIIFMYLNMLKHANIKRKEAIQYPPTLNVELEGLSDLTEAGIRIINISKGNENVRERGNDRIFSISFSIELYSSWSEDFEIDTIKKVLPDIENFN